MLKAALVIETPRRPLTRGAPSIDLTLDPQGGFTTGLSIDGDRLTALLADLTGKVRCHLALGLRAEWAHPRVVQAEIGSENPARGAAALPVFDGLVPSFDVLEKASGAGAARLRLL